MLTDDEELFQGTAQEAEDEKERTGISKYAGRKSLIEEPVKGRLFCMKKATEAKSVAFVIVRARPCFQDGVFRVPKNGMLETNKPLAMRVVGNALAYRKNLQCYNNAGSPTALQAEEVSIWI